MRAIVENSCRDEPEDALTSGAGRALAGVAACGTWVYCIWGSTTLLRQCEEERRERSASVVLVYFSVDCCLSWLGSEYR